MKKETKKTDLKVARDYAIFRRAVLARELEEVWLRLDGAEEIARELNLMLKFSRDSGKYRKLQRTFSIGLPKRAQAKAEAYFVVDSAICGKDMLSADHTKYPPAGFLPRRFSCSVNNLGKEALAVRAKHFSAK